MIPHALVQSPIDQYTTDQYTMMGLIVTPDSLSANDDQPVTRGQNRIDIWHTKSFLPCKRNYWPGCDHVFDNRAQLDFPYRGSHESANHRIGALMVLGRSEQRTAVR